MRYWAVVAISPVKKLLDHNARNVTLISSLFNLFFTIKYNVTLLR